MDRLINYAGAIPLHTDLLNTNRNAMVGLGKQAGAVLGSNTFVNGLACQQNSPADLTVRVLPGELYSLQNVDDTAFGSLAADTAHQILKQGILADTASLSCPAPGTAGFSINYLVQAAFSEVDDTAVALPYYNSSNPSQAWIGPGNNGTAQNTRRADKCVVTVKAGTAAATGSQATPSPDAGNVGLWVVTVANGQTTITSANISQYSGAPFVVQSGAASDAHNAMLTKSVAGNTDVTLTAQEAAYPIIKLTGALTGNINLIVPANSRQWVFINATTGNYSVTVKTATGTGRAAAQGSATIMYCDGTNVAQASSSGMGFSAYNDLSGANVLSAAYAGSLNDVTTANAQTLPAASSVPRGSAIWFTFSAAGSVQRTGADTMTINGTTGLLSQSGSVGGLMVCVSDGATVWTCNYIYTGQTFTKSQFTATAGQTSFAMTYTVGSVFMVTRNGPTVPYTATSGTAVVLGAAASAGDVIEVYQLGVFSVANALPLSGGTMSGPINMSGATVNEAVGASIASSATVNLGTATGNTVHITGTTSITAITMSAGQRRTVIFDGALTLTHNATTCNLPGGANITTAAGDMAVFISDGTTVYCVNYTKASGVPVTDLGIGQTWQDVTASRASGVTYTNSTGKPIQVKVCASTAAAGSAILNASVGGVALPIVQGIYASSGVTGIAQMEFIVPVGATYSVTLTGTGTPNIPAWVELR